MTQPSEDRSVTGPSTPHPDAGPDAGIATACQALGFDTLRAGQRRAVDALLAGGDVVVVMPTGSGKSAVYLVAGAVLGGLTVVVSPLRALQRDQLRSACALGEARALNADLSVARRRDVLDAVASGAVSTLFTGPEQLQRADVVGALAARPPALLAFDEAHCISMWGSDFRPDYLRVGAVVEVLGHPPVVALTATASPPVRTDITRRLGLDDPLVVTGGFDRPEIHLSVTHHHDPHDRDAALVADIVGLDGSGIVYTATKARTAVLVDALRAAGVSAAAYHGGLRALERRSVESSWRDGTTRVVVATSAFGMGIDKPDVRFVVHAEMAESLDAYAQEVGRAGRDGATAHATLHHRSEDIGLRRFFATRRPPPARDIRALLARLAAADGPLAIADLAEGASGIGRLSRALAVAEAAGAVEVVPGGAVLLIPGGPSADCVVAAGRDAADDTGSLERSRVEMIGRYADTHTCRRQVLRAYFGEDAPDRCGNCDVCLRSEPTGASQPTGADVASVERDVRTPETRATGPIGAGARVVHPAFGPGEVLAASAGQLTVVFDRGGYKTLDLELVQAGHLLTVEPA